MIGAQTCQPAAVLATVPFFPTGTSGSKITVTGGKRLHRETSNRSVRERENDMHADHRKAIKNAVAVVMALFAIAVSAAGETGDPTPHHRIFVLADDSSSATLGWG